MQKWCAEFDYIFTVHGYIAWMFIYSVQVFYNIIIFFVTQVEGGSEKMSVFRPQSFRLDPVEVVIQSQPKLVC